MATVIAFPVALVFCTGVVFWQAFVASILWGWFVVPFGLPALTMAWAFGLSAFLTVIKPNPYFVAKEKSGKDVVLSVLRSILNPAISLLIGWIALQWMPQP